MPWVHLCWLSCDSYLPGAALLLLLRHLPLHIRASVRTVMALTEDDVLLGC